MISQLLLANLLVTEESLGRNSKVRHLICNCSFNDMLVLLVEGAVKMLEIGGWQLIKKCL